MRNATGVLSETVKGRTEIKFTLNKTSESRTDDLTTLMTELDGVSFRYVASPGREVDKSIEMYVESGLCKKMLFVTVSHHEPE
jgi:hypothetical protein